MPRSTAYLALAIIALTFSVIAARASKVPPSDVVSGASIAVDSGHTTDTSATLFWHENKINGKLRIYWDTTPILGYPAHAIDSIEWIFLPDQIKSVRPQTATIPGTGQLKFKPGKTYWYFLQGFYPYPDHSTTELPPWPSMPPVDVYSNRGSFTTSTTMSVGSRKVFMLNPGFQMPRDASGRFSVGTSMEIGFTKDRPVVRSNSRTETAP